MNFSSKKQEAFVGIQGFLSKTPPIGGALKTLISDFVVREITPSGEILSTREEDDKQGSFDLKHDRYTIFNLIKKKTDTILAAKILQEFLNIPSRLIKWAGIKDNTAITSQRFAIKGNFVTQLKKFKHHNIALTNIRGQHNGIELGQLWGNHFTINIRRLIKPYDEIQDILQDWERSINTNGFPNYYGMQRFGQHRPNSHMIGKALFQGKYQEALEEFLYKTYPAEYENIAQFRQELNEQRNFAEVLPNFPYQLHYEKMIVEELASHPNDHLNAMFKLPNPLLNLILSSFQSYLFNSAVSSRMKNGYSLSQPVEGDVVAILNEIRGFPSLVFYKFGGWNDEAIIKAVQHERASIVAPVLGYHTDLSYFSFFKNIYEELLEKEDFSPNLFKHPFKQLYNFEGTYRAISNKPTRLTISPAYVTNNYPEKDETGVQLDFSLPKGTYATIFLRELLKKSELCEEHFLINEKN